MKLLKVLLGVLLFPAFMMAQSNTEGGAFVGVSNYKGDLANGEGLGLSNTNLALGVFLRHYVDSAQTIAVRGNLIYGVLSSDERDYRSEGRDFSFETTALEISIVGDWEVLKFFNSRSNVLDIFSPYVFAGVGTAIVNPRVNYGSSSSSKSAEDSNADYSSAQFVLPVGLGLKAKLGEAWTIGIEGGMRKVFSDYVDGVSISANPDSDDWYIFAGATVGYYIE
jgi:opacity protein-like surface antigen